jgi:hypothetical protein
VLSESIPQSINPSCAPAQASLAGNTSSLDGLDYTNCGPQVFIAAITMNVIRMIKYPQAVHAA